MHAPQKDALVGTLIGKYKVVRELGRGGYGVVYEVMQQTIGHRAAAKLLAPALTADPKQLKFVERFIDEARAVNLIDHPGVLKIFDLGELPDKTMYILMEFLEGETLQQRMEQLAKQSKRLSAHKVFLIAAQLASVLTAAHVKGIIHRDLKPENVFLIRDPDIEGGERTKLLDFGLARFLDSPERRTSAGMTLGTPTYMSPEQCLGLDTIDGRTDVYSLGVLLYQMLAGTPPFVGDMGRVMRAHCAEMPSPLSMRAPHASAAAANFVMMLLAKSPTQRVTMKQAEQTVLELLGKGELSKEEGSGDAPTPVAIPTTVLTAQTQVKLPEESRVMNKRTAMFCGVVLAAGLGTGFWVGRGSKQTAPTRVACPPQQCPQQKPVGIPSAVCPPSAQDTAKNAEAMPTNEPKTARKGKRGAN